MKLNSNKMKIVIKYKVSSDPTYSPSSANKIYGALA